MIYRPAVAEDIAALVQLEHQQPRCAQWNSNDWKTELAEKSAYVLCAKTDGVLAGFVALRLAAGVCEMLNVGVCAAYQRQGIGLALLTHALSWVREHGGQTVTLEVGAQNAAAIGLYQKAGFTPVGVRKQFYDSGEDALIMGKTL